MLQERRIKYANLLKKELNDLQEFLQLSTFQQIILRSFQIL
jgi:hypothetical protein